MQTLEPEPQVPDYTHIVELARTERQIILKIMWANCLKRMALMFELQSNAKQHTKST